MSYTPTNSEIQQAWVSWYATQDGYIAPETVVIAQDQFKRFVARIQADTLRDFAKKVYNGAPATREANFQAFYNDGLNPVLMHEAFLIDGRYE